MWCTKAGTLPASTSWFENAISGKNLFACICIITYRNTPQWTVLEAKSWRSRGGIDECVVCPNEFIFKVVPPWFHLRVFLLLTPCWFLSWNQSKSLPKNLLLIICLVNTLARDVYLYCLWVVPPPYGFRWQLVTCRCKNSEDLQGLCCDECGVSFCVCCYIWIRVTVTSHQLRQCW